MPLFGVGFLAIGGEWLQPAPQNFLIAAVALVVAHLPEKQPVSR
ncbi:hypothetical protein [Amycolatopsis lexingtonensis]